MEKMTFVQKKFDERTFFFDEITYICDERIEYSFNRTVMATFLLILIPAISLLVLAYLVFTAPEYREY